MPRTVTAVLVLLVVTSGCLGFVTGDEPLREQATPATVDEETLAETGFELDRQYERRVNETISVAGQERDVEAVNEVAEYNKTVDFGPLGEADVAVFSVVATPAFEIAGEAVSPVDEMDNRELAERVQDQYEGISIGEELDSRQIPTLGERMNVSRFEGTATVQGIDVDVFVHIGKVQHGGDFVIVVGIYPQILDGEEADVLAMIRGLEHES